MIAFNKKNLGYYIIGTIYVLCLGYIVQQMFQTMEGKILLFIYATSIFLTVLIFILAYKITELIINYIDDKDEEGTE